MIETSVMKELIERGFLCAKSFPVALWANTFLVSHKTILEKFSAVDFR